MIPWHETLRRGVRKYINSRRLWAVSVLVVKRPDLLRTGPGLMRFAFGGEAGSGLAIVMSKFAEDVSVDRFG
jgi:hypothetical protein